MTPPLFVVASLGSGDTLELTGAEAHHATVKRLGVGELVWLADGRGGLAEAEVAEAGRDRLLLTVLSRRQQPERQPRFTVVQALPKGERAELAVEVLTELGVDEIVPWAASRSIAVWRGEKAARGVERWRRTAVEAAKQSRRHWFPEVCELAGTAAVADRVAAADLALVLHEDAVPSLASVSLPASGEVLLVVGPEGGVAPEELAAFADRGARTVRLGPEVLRTSTAGAAALAVLSAGSGRWG
ncbi:MAG TPA: 16S rRNA (uracil(1498)-N(3))-methyltransferase [Jatrophihabitans sp.]|nr:16S rRNA (uracil(1498)-N(3))-methyltransferase [Jatrophihabitans sp.]